MTQLKSLSDIKRANKACGGHWFDRSSMRFFNSIVSKVVHPSPHQDRTYFVSSEQFDDSTPRLYSVRVVFWSGNMPGAGNIETIGEFQKYETLAAAQSAAAKFAAQHRPEPTEFDKYRTEAA